MVSGEPDLSRDLSGLLELQVEMYNSSQMVAGPGGSIPTFGVFAGWEDRIKKYVERVGQIAGKYNCSYTITIGIPWGISASFNFAKQEDERRA